MANNNSKDGDGLAFLGGLTIVFIILKLTGNIAWSWWWVLSPLWLPVVSIIGVGFLTWLFLQLRN